MPASRRGDELHLRGTQGLEHALHAFEEFRVRGRIAFVFGLAKDAAAPAPVHGWGNPGAVPRNALDHPGVEVRAEPLTARKGTVLHGTNAALDRVGDARGTVAMSCDRASVPRRLFDHTGDL